MGKRKDKGHQVICRHDKAGVTDVWHKNRAGNTTKDGHRRINHKTGSVTNHYGKLIHKKR